MTVPSSQIQVLIWDHDRAPVLIALLAISRQSVAIDTERRAENLRAVRDIANRQGIKQVSWGEYIDDIDKASGSELRLEFHELV